MLRLVDNHKSQIIASDHKIYGYRSQKLVVNCRVNLAYLKLQSLYPKGTSSGCLRHPSGREPEGRGNLISKDCGAYYEAFLMRLRSLSRASLRRLLRH